MRVLLTTDVVGGVWRYTVTLVRELTGRGHECAVAVIGEPDDARLAELPADVAVFSRDLRLEWMPDGLDDHDAGTNWLVDLAEEWRPDIIHLNQFTYATGRFSVPVVVVAHSDVLSWHQEVRGRPAPPEWKEYAAAVRAGIDAADAIVAPTGYQSGWLAGHYGRSAIRVIHNGTPPPPLPRDLPAASKRPMILVAGRAWDEAKGIALLDEAVATLGDTAPTVHLVGPLEGPGGERLEAEHLVTHGEVDGSTMGRFYVNTRLYVAPSLYEPFGLAPLEAAGHGCGLLLSGIGSFRELWSDAADFFEPHHPEVLAARLITLLEDPARLDELAGNALTRARTHYTAGSMAEEYVRLYRELIGSQPGSAPPVPSHSVAGS